MQVKSIAECKGASIINIFVLSILSGSFTQVLLSFEFFQLKCGIYKKKIWPWVAQEIQPTLDELGILTPAQMGYDKPELAVVDPFEIH